MKRLVTDFRYFCSRLTISAFDYTKPPGVDNVPVPRQFILAPHQIDLINHIEDTSISIDRILLKCRQIGASTVLSAYCLWRLLYRQSESILFLCKSDDDAFDNTRDFREWLVQLGGYAPSIRVRDKTFFSIRVL